MPAERLSMRRVREVRLRHALGMSDRSIAQSLGIERRPGDRMAAASFYPRVSNDTPNVDAFCQVAARVRLRDFAIFAAGVF
jgi:hypothetical protein